MIVVDTDVEESLMTPKDAEGAEETRHSARSAVQASALRLILVLVGSLALLVASTAPPLTDHGQIAFISDRDGNWEVYVMNVDGSGQTRLTDNPAEEWLPAWSPDGSRIAFVSNRDGDWGLYVMNIKDALQGTDGGEPGTLARNPAGDWDPTWSPDGARIAFSSPREGNWEIFVMNLDGSGQANLTGHPANDWLPTWSPDGSHIAFVSDRDGNWEIYVLNVEDALQGTDGSEQTNLSHNPADDWVPAWSPDGRYIAFQSERDGDWEIYVLGVEDALQGTDGSGPTNLTQHPADDWDPSWSPDGRCIVFMSEREGNRELYVMDKDGARVIRLTNNPAADKNPAWSP